MVIIIVITSRAVGQVERQQQQQQQQHRNLGRGCCDVLVFPYLFSLIVVEESRPFFESVSRLAPPPLVAREKKTFDCALLPFPISSIIMLLLLLFLFVSTFDDRLRPLAPLLTCLLVSLFCSVFDFLYQQTNSKTAT